MSPPSVNIDKVLTRADFEPDVFHHYPNGTPGAQEKQLEYEVNFRVVSLDTESSPTKDGTFSEEIDMKSLSSLKGAHGWHG